MKGGDISNQLAPAIMVNVDLLGEIRRKGLLQKKSFSLYKGAGRVLLQLFNLDLAIYLVISDEKVKYAESIKNELEYFFIPYTRLYELENDDEAEELPYLLDQPHVIAYFYEKNTLQNERMEKGKQFQILNISEIMYILEGRK